MSKLNIDSAHNCGMIKDIEVVYEMEPPEDWSMEQNKARIHPDLSRIKIRFNVPTPLNLSMVQIATRGDVIVIEIEANLNGSLHHRVICIDQISGAIRQRVSEVRHAADVEGESTTSRLRA